MIWKNALKYPVLIVGIILFGLYITNPKTKEYWSKYNRRFIPSTCDAIKDRVAPKVDSSWELECPGTQLLIVKVNVDGAKTPKQAQALRVYLYKKLVNSLHKLTALSNLETMGFLKIIKMRLIHPNLEIIAKTDGEALVQLLNKKDEIKRANHLKLTVKTKEISK